MKFTIFKKTVEYKEHKGDWDGDEGYDVEIEIAEEKLHRDIAEMIYDDYIKRFTTEETEKRYFGIILDQIECMLNDIDCWDKVTELYFNDLKNKYGESV